MPQTVQLDEAELVAVMDSRICAWSALTHLSILLTHLFVLLVGAVACFRGQTARMPTVVRLGPRNPLSRITCNIHA